MKNLTIENSLRRIVIFGNSGSGKTTLAAQLKEKHRIPALCLDTIYWTPNLQGVRRPADITNTLLMKFINQNNQWIIEGCQGELINAAVLNATQIFFLNPGKDVCIENHRNRPWEPKNYISFYIQQKFMAESLKRITEYYDHEGFCSSSFHQKIFDDFQGDKTVCNDRVSGVDWSLKA